MRRLILLAAVGVLLLACGLAAPTPTPSEGPPAGVTRAAPPITAAPLEGVALPPALPRFAAWVLPPGAALPASPSGGGTALPALADLANPGDLFPLNESQRALLAANGFVVVEEPAATLAAIYADAAADRRPVLITADLLLSTTAAAVAATWHAVAPQLEADLAALLAALQPAAVAQWEGTEPGSPAEEAARAHAAYLSVAASLLGEGVDAPAPIGVLVADELTLIGRGAGVFRSPIQGYEVDYGPFAGQPPGAQALLWLSRLEFVLDGDPALVRRQARQVLLLRAALEESDNRSRWERLDVALGYFWGEPAGLTMADVDALARGVPGLGAGEGLEERALDVFIATARQFGTGVRFLPFTGQRPTPLTGVGRALTFNRVGVYDGAAAPLPLTGAETGVGVVRVVSHPLDGAAALGSARAVALLQAAGETGYEGFEAQLAAAAAVLAARDEAAWSRTLPEAWVYATAPLLAPSGAALPSFMQTEAWGDRQLWAWLGAQVLPLVGLIGGGDAGFSGAEVVYVEPQVTLYVRLAALVGQLRRGVADRGLAPEPELVRLALWEEILVQLARISGKQLADIDLAPDEEALLNLLGPRMGAAAAPLGAPAAPGVAAGYRDPAGGGVRYDVLTAALPLYALVPAGGGEGSVVAVGAVWAGTARVQPAAQPLTAAGWLALPAPERALRPIWTNRFTAPGE